MTLTLTDRPSYEQLLHEEVAQYYADPLGFVLAMWPWGEPGPLEAYDGPQPEQAAFLAWVGDEVAARGFNGVDPVDPIRGAISSGHGVGKGALTGMLVAWIMSTRPHAKGVVTANTNTQLQDKTWAAIQTWVGRCKTAHWFEINSSIMYRRGYRPTWRCSPQSCAPENSEAFAGQHNLNSTSFYINDEDSAVPDAIHEVQEGGLTDGEPMYFLFGNPTRNTGAFHRAVFGAGRDRWRSWVIDSRQSALSNKRLIQEWAEDYGEESDFFRVRVRGLPPLASELQFIPADLVAGAATRVVAPLPDEPLIAGVDVSGGGSAWTVCRFRRGPDARTLPPIRIPGAMSTIEDRPRIVAILAERLAETAPATQIAAMFVDSAFGAPLVERLHALGFRQVHEVSFGAASPDARQANQRAYMWNKGKEWLAHGAIAKDDHRFHADLMGPGFHLNQKNQLVIESKESMRARGIASPDDGDAHHLTFAAPVAPPRVRVRETVRSGAPSPWV